MKPNPPLLLIFATIYKRTLTLGFLQPKKLSIWYKYHVKESQSQTLGEYLSEEYQDSFEQHPNSIFSAF